MKIRIVGVPHAMTISVDFSRKGLAFIGEIDFTVETFPKFSATVQLRWSEVLVICAIMLVLGIAVNFRKEISEMGLISVWAPQHTPTVAAIIGTTAFMLGSLLAFWKKKQLFVYAIWEIAFGVFSAFEIGLVLFPDQKPAQFLALASTLYVVSRGAGNLIEAFDKEVNVERVKYEVKHGIPPEPWPPSILKVSPRKSS